MLPGAIGKEGSTSGERAAEEREKKVTRPEAWELNENSGFDQAVGRKSAVRVSEAVLNVGETQPLPSIELTTDPQFQRMSTSLKLRAVSAGSTGSGPIPDASMPSGGVAPVGYVGAEATQIMVLKQRLPPPSDAGLSVSDTEATGVFELPFKPQALAPAARAEAARSSSWDDGLGKPAGLNPLTEAPLGQGLLNRFGGMVRNLCQGFMNAVRFAMHGLGRILVAIQAPMRSIWATRGGKDSMGVLTKMLNEIREMFAKARGFMFFKPKPRVPVRTVVNTRILQDLARRLRRIVIRDAQGDHMVEQSERLSLNDLERQTALVKRQRALGRDPKLR